MLTSTVIMIRNYKIALLVVWFGKFPSSIEIWADSAEHQSVDFIFVTDQEQPSFCKSFKWINTSLKQLRVKIETKLKTPIKLSYAYKLCDFKPAYGDIFSELLTAYDYWGSCDLDLVFGSLDAYFELALSTNPDKISSRGHVTLYKNVESINNLYKSDFVSSKGVTNYKEIYNDEKYCLFDETNGIHRIALEKKIKYFQDISWIDIDPNSIYFNPIIFPKKPIHIYVYHKGKLFYIQKESRLFTDNLTSKRIEPSYLHFQKRKIDFSAFDKRGVEKFYLITSKCVKPFDSIEHLLSEKDVFNDVNLRHYLVSFYKKLLVKLRIRPNIFNFYLHTDEFRDYVNQIPVGTTFNL